MLPPRRIVAAVPPNGLAPAVVARAVKLAQRFGAALRLSSCVYDAYLAGERFADSADLREARELLVNARRDALEAMASTGRAAGLDVSVAAAWGYPVHEVLLAAAAEFDAELLVCGTFHHSLLQRLGLTNTDWQLLEQSRCPVLLVRGEAAADYRRVLVAADPMHTQDPQGSLDDRLVSAAQAMVAAANGRLQLLHCYLTAGDIPLVAPGAGIPGHFHDRSSPQSAHRDAMLALVERHGLEPACIRMESGDARQLIPQLAETWPADLVVMGAVSRSRLARLLIGSTAESVLDALRCDALVIKPALPG